MAIQVRAMSFHCLSFLPRIKKNSKENAAALPTLLYISSRRTIRSLVRSSTDSSSSSGRWEEFLKQLPTAIPCLSDVLWPSAGAFVAMAILGRLDQLWAHRGLSFTIAPIGAVCAVLFAAPKSPAAQKYNMFVAQIGCAAIGVLALSIFGPGWLARATALAASIAFMTVTGSIHPPAASLPILFIDGAKFHHLNLWYALFPGATGCLLICLIQEVVTFLKSNYRF
ncbi:hypothetical protein IEQ34_002043 [Dendrobium chrysotoxum]|uniref:HPP transmembrane region domain-containing protein n=1 Tax=Dendrobium chrysotoxum TaxID=161865 RepID=A0AAV7HII3_DENCH|nr:hypothetical protein IEQ34_002043 [Dendrobium chrysotoxum]